MGRSGSGSGAPGGRRDLDGGDEAAVGEAEPAVLAPGAELERGLAAERAAARAGERAGAEVGVVDEAVGGLDDLAVAGALEGRVGGVLRGEEEGLGVELVGAEEALRAGHGHRVVVAGAALGGGEVVPAAALEEVRALDEAVRRAGEDVADRAGQAARGGVVLLAEDAVEGGAAGAAADAVGGVLPLLVQEPLAAVVVVEERRVEARGVEVDRVRPGAGDRGRGDEVVVGVLEVAVEPLHVGVDQPEQPVGVG